MRYAATRSNTSRQEVVMNKVLAGVMLGVAAAVWTTVYMWVANPHIQALMVFIGILSAVRAVSASSDERDGERYRA